MRHIGSSQMRHFEHGMLGILLAGALGSSLLASALRWPETAPSGLPGRTSVVVLVAGTMAVTLLPVRQRHGSLVNGAAFRFTAIALTAVAMALVLQRSANSFYTAPSLLDGMIGLLVLHLASRVMRWIAVELRETFFVVKPMGSERRRTRWVRQLVFVPQQPRLRTLQLPAVALADALASVSAWTLLAFWVLVALERRHLASGALVFTATLLVLECAMLIPDTLAALGMLPRGLQAARDRSPNR